MTREQHAAVAGVVVVVGVRLGQEQEEEAEAGVVSLVGCHALSCRCCCQKSLELKEQLETNNEHGWVPLPYVFVPPFVEEREREEKKRGLSDS